MNYKRIYDELIENAKHRNITGYIEKHHILPRSMGGNEDKENIVKLTAREHYIAHWLLTKFVPAVNKKSMNYALWLMSQDNTTSAKGYRITSRHFEYNRKQHRIMKSGVNNPQYGKPSWISGKTKDTCSIVARIAEQKIGVGNAMYGKNHSTATRQLMSVTHTGENSSYFKGYYLTPFGKFASTHLAEKATGLTAQTILNWCKANNHKKFTGKGKAAKKFPDEWKGKTFKELGFGFEEIDQSNI